MKLTANDVMGVSPIVPVIVVDDASKALDLAKALHEGGISIMEITLRTADGLKAIEKIAKELPEIYVGSGTVCTPEDYRNSVNSGAKFAFSPGISPSLIAEYKKYDIPFIPGVSSASEVMIAKEHGLLNCKLFPASLVGGVPMLKAFAGPFGDIKFCPTGGINLNNMNDFLALDNVLCVGGSWLANATLLNEKKFSEISKIAQDSLKQVKVMGI